MKSIPFIVKQLLPTCPCERHFLSGCSGQLQIMETIQCRESHRCRNTKQRTNSPEQMKVTLIHTFVLTDCKQSCLLQSEHPSGCAAYFLVWKLFSETCGSTSASSAAPTGQARLEAASQKETALGDHLPQKWSITFLDMFPSRRPQAWSSSLSSSSSSSLVSSFASPSSYRLGSSTEVSMFGL